MSKPYTGGCPCGAIHYEIAAEPIAMNDCQCRDCQATSGTGHGSYLTFPSRQAVTLKGEATHWDMVADSGNVKTRASAPPAARRSTSPSLPCPISSPFTPQASTIPTVTSRRW